MELFASDVLNKRMRDCSETFMQEWRSHWPELQTLTLFAGWVAGDVAEDIKSKGKLIQ